MTTSNYVNPECFLCIEATTKKVSFSSYITSSDLKSTSGLSVCQMWHYSEQVEVCCVRLNRARLAPNQTSAG